MKNNLIVPCNKLFKPVKHDTGIIGYWLDNGKVYQDNISIVDYYSYERTAFRKAKQSLFYDGELCIFYINTVSEGVIEYPNGKKTILKHRIEIKENKKPCMKYIQELLRQHGGCALYKIAEDSYIIEIYKE